MGWERQRTYSNLVVKKWVGAQIYFIPGDPVNTVIYSIAIRNIIHVPISLNLSVLHHFVVL